MASRFTRFWRLIRGIFMRLSSIGVGVTRPQLPGVVGAVVSGLRTIGAFSNSMQAFTQGQVSILFEGSPVDSQTWGNAGNATAYGTGTNPTSPNADDTRDPAAPLYVEWTAIKDGESYSGRFAYRQTPPTRTSDPAISFSGTDISVDSEGGFSGAGQTSIPPQWWIDVVLDGANEFISGTQLTGLPAFGTIASDPSWEGRAIRRRTQRQNSGGVRDNWSNELIGLDLSPGIGSMAIGSTFVVG